jgi:hypothetical protein
MTPIRIPGKFYHGKPIGTLKDFFALTIYAFCQAVCFLKFYNHFLDPDFLTFPIFQ